MVTLNSVAAFIHLRGDSIKHIVITLWCRSIQYPLPSHVGTVPLHEGLCVMMQVNFMNSKHSMLVMSFIEGYNDILCVC